MATETEWWCPDCGATFDALPEPPRDNDGKPVGCSLGWHTFRPNTNGCNTPLRQRRKQ